MVGRYHGHTDLRCVPLSGVKVRNVDLSRIDFFAATLEGAELDRVNLMDSWLSHANLQHTAFKWSQMDGVLMDDVAFDDKTTFVGIDLRTINFTLAALLHEHALREPRIQHLNRHNPILAYFLSVTCDYGRSFPRFLCSCIVIIAVFSIAFHFSPHAINKPDFANSVFFSFLSFLKIPSMNIFASSPLGRALFVSEAALGYIMLGLLVSIIVRRTIGR